MASTWTSGKRFLGKKNDGMMELMELVFYVFFFGGGGGGKTVEETDGLREKRILYEVYA